jgi:hypothetical protein
MKTKNRVFSSAADNFQIFTDMALMMLGTFIFLLVLFVLTSKVAEQTQAPKMSKQIADMALELQDLKEENLRLLQELGELSGEAVETQLETILQQAGVGAKDFNLFIDGLKDIPGKDLHLVIDATGSMHGAGSFLIPILKAIVVRSEKRLSAITWFSDGSAGTYTGTMGEMFDQLMQGAPFVGANETIGNAFVRAAQNAPVPGAYLLIGDEPSDDRIAYRSIPAPVFTLPIGRSDPSTEGEYASLAERTGGKMLHLQFQ